MCFSSYRDLPFVVVDYCDIGVILLLVIMHCLLPWLAFHIPLCRYLSLVTIILTEMRFLPIVDVMIGVVSLVYFVNVIVWGLLVGKDVGF